MKWEAFTPDDLLGRASYHYRPRAAPPADPRPADHVGDGQAGDAARLGLARSRLHRAQRARSAPRLVALAGGAGSHVAVPLQGSGTFVVEAMLGDAACPGTASCWCWSTAPMAERMVEIARLSRPRVAALDDARGPAERPAGARPGARRRSRDQPRRRGAVRDHLGHPQPDRSRSRQITAPPWPAAADRCDERLRRAAARCPRGAVRRARGLGQQVPRGRAGGRLRDRPHGRARGGRGQLRQPVARSPRPVAGDGAQRPVALHPADPRARRVRSGAGRARGRGRHRRARRALPRELPDPGRRHARAGLRDPAARRAAGADHRHLQDAGRPALRVRRLLRPAARQGLRDLSRQADRGALASGSAASATSAPAEMQGALAAIRATLAEIGVASGAPAAAAA